MFLCSMLCAVAAYGDMNRLIVADQSDFAGAKGFYVSMENDAPDGQSCKLQDLKVIFAVADGKNWSFLTFAPHANVGDLLRIHAKYDGHTAVLWVNDNKVASTDSALVVAPRPFQAGEHPSWARGPAEYSLVEKSINVTNPTSFAANPTSAETGPLAVFEAPPTWSHELKTRNDGPFELTATVLVGPAAAQTRTPYHLVDRYGQAVAANWPGKIKSDRQLRDAIGVEAKAAIGWKPRTDTDKFGGQLGTWSATATGYYRVERHNKVWWLISPEGHPLFYTGICTAPALNWEMTPYTGRPDLWTEVPPRDGLFKNVWTQNAWGVNEGVEYFGPQMANLIRKYGADWEKKATDSFAARTKEWGFVGAGKWSSAVPGLPWVSVLYYGDVPHVGRHVDVFDPEIMAKVKAGLETAMKDHLADPYLVGWSIGNEFDEIITTDEIKDLWKSRSGRPIDRALAEWLDKANPSDADFEAARQAYATKYYGALYRLVKEIDPHHLYLGFWIVPGWWQNSADWDMIAGNCDVLGYDRYANGYPGIEDLLRRISKPTLIGEFSFPAWYDGKRGYGRYGNAVSSDLDTARAYASWMEAAAKDPGCVGSIWFQYRDQPITGRGAGHGNEAAIGEHFAFGVVDVTDVPKWDVVKRMRAVNLKLNNIRLALKP